MSSNQTCVGIKLEKIRATVNISGYEVNTPDVKAFSIDKARGRLTASFSLTVEVPVSASFILGSDILIYAGTMDNEKKTFTGIIKRVSVQPCFDKPGYFTFNITGTDKMGVLENKNFSRRLRSDGMSLFCGITSGATNKPTRGFSLEKRVRGGQHQMVSKTPRPQTSEHSELTKMPTRGVEKNGPYGKATDVGMASAQKTASGKVPHTHENMDQLGPAWGVYSTD
jgi:hypothetical protein